MNGLLGGSGLSALLDLLGGKNGSQIMSLLPALLEMLGGTSKTSSTSRTSKTSKTSKSKTSRTSKTSKVASGPAGASGLEEIIGGLSSGGLSDIVGSWVGGGPNKSITPAQVKKGLGAKKIAQLSAQTGMPADEVTQHLSELLPVVVNHLTPEAQVPQPSALEAALQGLQGLLPRA